MPNWYTINHPTTLHTHNETVTHCCSPMAICAAGCILQAKLPSLDTQPPPGSPRLTILSASSVRTLANLLTSSHPQMLASRLLGLQGLQQTPALTTVLVQMKHTHWYLFCSCITAYNVVCRRSLCTLLQEFAQHCSCLYAGPNFTFLSTLNDIGLVIHHSHFKARFLISNCSQKCI